MPVDRNFGGLEMAGEETDPGYVAGMSAYLVDIWSIDDVQLSIIRQLRFCTFICVSTGGWYIYGLAGKTTTPFQHAATSTGFSFLIRSMESWSLAYGQKIRNGVPQISLATQVS
jgi:hypothetical protein